MLRNCDNIVSWMNRGFMGCLLIPTLNWKGLNFPVPASTPGKLIWSLLKNKDKDLKIDKEIKGLSIWKIINSCSSKVLCVYKAT